MAQDGSRRLNWARLPLIATVARVLCREVTLEAEYLRVQYEVVRSKVPGRIRFTDEDRRRLVDAALAMGQKATRCCRARAWSHCEPPTGHPTRIPSSSAGVEAYGRSV